MDYVKHSQTTEGAISHWISPGSAVMIALALADYGPVPDASSAYLILSNSGRNVDDAASLDCRCLGDGCSSVDGVLPVNQCDALQAHLEANGMSQNTGIGMYGCAVLPIGPIPRLFST